MGARTSTCCKCQTRARGPARYTCRGGTTHVQPRAIRKTYVRPARCMVRYGSSKQFPRLCGVLFLCAVHRMHQSDKQVRIGRRWACMQKGNTYLHAWCLQLHCKLQQTVRGHRRPCTGTADDDSPGLTYYAVRAVVSWRLERSRFRRFILPAGLDWTCAGAVVSGFTVLAAAHECGCVGTTYPRSLSCLLYCTCWKILCRILCLPVPNNDYHYTYSVRTKLDEQELASYVRNSTLAAMSVSVKKN